MEPRPVINTRVESYCREAGSLDHRYSPSDPKTDHFTKGYIMCAIVLRKQFDSHKKNCFDVCIRVINC